jgi:hypothetical protein
MFRILLLLIALFIGGWIAWPAFSAYQIYSGMKTADEDVLQRKINWESMRASLRPVVAGEVEKALGNAGGGGLMKALGPGVKQKFMPQIVDMALKNIVTPSGLAQVMAQGGDVSSAVSSVVSKQIGKLGGLGALTGGGSSSGGSSGGGLGGLVGGLLGGKGGDAAKGAGGLLGGLLGNKKVREMAGEGLGKLGGKLMGGKKQADSPAQAAKKGPSYGLSNIKRFAYTGLGSMELGVARDPAAKGPDVTAVMEFQNFDWKLTGLVPHLK